MFLIGNGWMRVVLSYKDMPVGVLGWNKNSKELIDMDCPWSCIVVHGATRGGGLRKNMIGETPCSHFRNSISTESVIRTSIIWLSLFARSLVISLHVGTSSVVLSPRGCSDYG